MAEVIIMPKLGFNMDSGQLVAWHRKVGEAVKKGEPLFDINTDKTTMPVEATSDGVLLKVMLAEGEFADVFTPIAVVGAQGEDPEAALAAHGGGGASGGGGAAAAPEAGTAAAPAAAAGASAAPTGDLKLTPKARALVAREGIDPASLSGVQGTGYRGGITARDIKASPLAKKIAGRDGVDLASVQGSGHGGKIMAADVRGAGSAPAAAVGALGKTIAKTVPYSGVRKIIGDRLAQSKFTAPHLYFTDSVDMSAFTAFRKQVIEQTGQKIAVSDFFTLAAARALQKYPDVNVSLEGDRIVYWDSVNIGNAVAGDQGLIVPVIKEVQRKTLTGIARESRDLVERAKAGRLSPDEFNGGTFTISNLGMFGIENFTAIINPPESAILAVSSTRKKAVVLPDASGNDAIFIRPMMNIQLTVDHRLIDGLLAAQWVACFKGLLENPVTILM